MGRLPFDPDKMAGARRKPKPEKDADAPWRVSELAARIDSALRAGLPTRVTVAGEVSGFGPRTHWYFTLKDADASVNVVMFASATRRSPYEPTDGAQVVVSGRVDFYAPSGRVSLVADSVRPVGVGEAKLAFRKLLEELKSEGLLDPDRKRQLPAIPRRIAVITSAGGAAKHDVIDTCRRRWPAAELLIVDAVVQGERAEASVVAGFDAIGAAVRTGSEIDAVILTRGGGSAEDLAAFNTRGVAMAVSRCPVPVVAAIGHETDTTIAELVADERAATPTQAALRLTPDRAELERQVLSRSRTLTGAIARRIERGRATLSALARRPVVREPMGALRPARERVERCERDLSRAGAARITDAALSLRALARRLEHFRPSRAVAADRERFERARRRLAVLAGRSVADAGVRLGQAEALLDAFDPARVLGRGYAWTTDAEGRLVTSARSVRPGDRVRTRLADGSFDSTVDGAPGAAMPGLERAGPSPKRRRRRKRPADDGPGLFDAGSGEKG